MEGSLHHCLERLRLARTGDDLQREILALRDVFEVGHLVYHSVNSTGEQYAALTYSPDWVARYVSQSYERIDPVVQGCYRRFHPIDWRALDWTSRAARSFLHEALDHGVGTQGLSLPIRGPGGQFAVFTVNDTVSDESWTRLRDERLSDLILVAHFVNQKALELEGNRDAADLRALSPREIDALTLLAAGHNRAAIADRLHISEHTLRVYIESARHKLGAMNTVHAVARAMVQGLIVV